MEVGIGLRSICFFAIFHYLPQFEKSKIRIVMNI